MTTRPPITLRDWHSIDVSQLKGVGEKKTASLAAFDIYTVLDLVTTYPRRWVDRTNEARIRDLALGERRAAPGGKQGAQRDDALEAALGVDDIRVLAAIALEIVVLGGEAAQHRPDRLVDPERERLGQHRRQCGR